MADISQDRTLASLLLRGQGTADSDRYTTVPRTLSFLLCRDSVLLLRGAPTKRLWSNRLNGLGGHVEPTENPRQSALREIREESGLSPTQLGLRALVHVSGREGLPGVMLFVFVGHVDEQPTLPSAEGQLEWHPTNALPWQEMVDDLPHLLPRLLGSGAKPMLFACYSEDSTGALRLEYD